jgi:hypothetical protein
MFTAPHPKHEFVTILIEFNAAHKVTLDSRSFIQLILCLISYQMKIKYITLVSNLTRLFRYEVFRFVPLTIFPFMLTSVDNHHHIT